MALPAPLLADTLPELAKELVSLLSGEGRSSLASQVPALRVVDRCRCGHDSCATFYTAQRPKGGWGPKHENIALDPAVGVLVLDLVDATIVAVEVLDRDEIRVRLNEVLR